MIKGSVWIAFLVQGIALILFSAGFFEFRQKVVESDNASVEYPEATYDRFVFVLLDALRSDFVFGNGTKFEFLKEKLDIGREAKGFVALAKIPTVTLPRLKAMTAGSSPVFLDLLLNFDENSLAADSVDTEELQKSSGFPQENWVKSLKRVGRKIWFFGDDTWLRLFPDCFEHSSPVHSFFVTDYTDVDNSVTDAAIPAIKSSGWDTIIMHYLGIDHIGHLDGALSPLMGPKHKEMDSIIKNIYELLREKDSLDGKRSLILVAGDHGMADNGNHGGSSEKEISTAAIFLSPSLDFSNSNSKQIPIVNQVDLVPTISCLLGIPVPNVNTGKLISAVIPIEKLESYQRFNLRQLISLSKQDCEISGIDLEKQLLDAASQVENLSGGYNLGYMIAASFLLTLALALLLVVRLKFAYDNQHSTNCISELAFVIFYIALQSSSSFIEEEHEFWFFALTSLIAVKTLFLGAGQNLPSALAALIFSRLPRNWNAVGYQALQVKDSKIWLLPKSPITNLVIGMSLLFGFWNWNRSLITSGRKNVSRFTYALAASVVFAFKSGYLEDQQLLARMAYATIIVAFTTSHSIDSVHAVFYLLSIFLLKPHNALILTVIFALSKLLAHTDEATILNNALRVALVHFSYFALGPSNLIVSLDFSNAYIGFSSFNFPLISLITFLITWSGPILASFFIFTQVRKCKDRSEHFMILDLAIWKIFVTTSLLISLIFQRHHLFVWSVFAPRLLFEFGWFLFYGLIFVIISSIN